MKPFARGEYEGRIARVKAAMERRGFDVLLVTSPANIFYLTGYDACSFYTHQMIVLGLDAAEPIWVGRGLDVSSARHTVFMDEANIRGYGDEYVSAADRHPMQFVASVVEAQRWGAARIGVEMDSYYFTARCWEALKAALPNARFGDADTLVNWERLVKSEAELTYMRQAGRIAERTAEATIEAIAEGSRENDAVSHLYAAQIAGTPEHGGDYACKPPVFGAGPRVEAVHLTWQDRVYRAGDLTWFETCGCRHHYHAPISRTVHLGRPPQALLDRASFCIEGLEAALDAARPGNVCEDVEEAWRRVVSRHGIEKESRVGYPVGIGFAPTWGELTCSLRRGDRTELRPGMAFHLIPGVWRADGTICISESFEVTEGGARTFADFRRRLEWKET